MTFVYIILFIISIIDIMIYRVPLILLGILGVFGIFYGPGYYKEAFFMTILVWCVGKGMEKLLYKPAMGKGDRDLMGICALFLNFSQWGFFFVSIGLLGLITASFYKKKEVFPFAPAIAGGFFLTKEILPLTKEIIPWILQLLP